MFFGPVGISLVFNMLFLYRFCRKLEETSFAGNTAGFIIMLLFGASITLVSEWVGVVYGVDPSHCTGDRDTTSQNDVHG